MSVPRWILLLVFLFSGVLFSGTVQADPSSHDHDHVESTAVGNGSSLLPPSMAVTEGAGVPVDAGANGAFAMDVVTPSLPALSAAPTREGNGLDALSVEERIGRPGQRFR